ncbi:MAG: tetratricopeptide repeat protein [Candidatus Omnitrophota bacterium]
MRSEHKKYIVENIDKKPLKEIARELGLKEKKIKRFLDKEAGKKARKVSREGTASPLKKKTILISLLLIAVLGFGIYFNSFEGEFLWDDIHLVKKNIYVKDFSYIKEIFTQHVGAGARRPYHFYRPLQTLTYAIDYHLWNASVVGYHFTNVLLHCLVAFCVYWLAWVLFRNQALAIFAGLLFVAHPLHTEAISYISGRPDPLATLFLLVSFILYIKLVDRDNLLFFLSGLLSYALALLSREATLILPALLLLYHAAFNKKIKPIPLLSWAALACAYIALRVFILRSILPQDVGDATAIYRAPGSFVAITNYMRLLFVPTDLHMGYGRKLFSWIDPKTISGIFILISLITVAFIRKRKSDSLVFFSICFFFIALFPYCNIAFPINAYMAEHWLYLPSIGFFFLAAKGLSLLYKNERFKIITIAAVLGILSFYSFQTFKQNTYWSDPYLFYIKTLEYVKDSPEVYNNLGVIYGERGEYDEAIPLFKKSVETDPDYGDSYFNLGKAYNDTGKKKEAISYYEKAIEVFPEIVSADTYYNLGSIYLQLEMYKEAQDSIKKALKLNPAHVHANINLGICYHNAGNDAEAIKFFKRAIELEPADPYAYTNLAAVYFKSGRYEEALDYSEKARERGMTNSVLTEALEEYRKRTEDQK